MNESIVLMVEEHENIRRMLRVVRSMCEVSCGAKK